MADKVNVGDVVRLDKVNWSYDGKFKEGDVAVVRDYYNAENKDWVNLGDEIGAPHYIRIDGLSVLTGVDFEDLDDVREGDTLLATTQNKGLDTYITAGDEYVAEALPCGCCYSFRDDCGDLVDPSDDVYYFVNVSAELRSTAEVEVEAPALEAYSPLTWNEMSDAAKGLLLLAAHEGATIQYYSPLSKMWFDDEDWGDGSFAYRVKPEALVEAEQKVSDSMLVLTSLRAAVNETTNNLNAHEVSHQALLDELKTLRAA